MNGTILRGTFILLALFAQSGCESVNHLREAQSAFNETAVADNVMRLGLSSGPRTATSSAPDSPLAIDAGYASVIASLNRLADSPKQREALKKDGLWGVALTMKGLSYWRLGKHDQVDALVKEAQTAMTETAFGDRDRALIGALPGLVRNTQAYQKIRATTPACLQAAGGCTDQEPGFAEVACLLVSANTKIAEARAFGSERNPVQVFLLQSQLTALRNISEALKKYGLRDAKDPLKAKGTFAQEALDYYRVRSGCALGELDGLAKDKDDATKEEIDPVDGAREASQFWRQRAPGLPNLQACKTPPAAPAACINRQ